MILPVILAFLAVVLAAAIGAADGALLAVHTSPEHASDSAAEQERRERLHRSLAVALVFAYTSAGVALILFLDNLHISSVWRISIALLAAFTIVAAPEGAARSMAYGRGPKAHRRLEPLARSVNWVMLPFTMAATMVERFLHALLPRPTPDDDSREATAEQFREVMAAEAEISVREEELMLGVFEMADTEVREIMVPRVDIVGIEAETPWSEVVDRFRSAGHARLPVYDGTIDEVIGILYAKDLLLDIVQDHANDGWRTFARPAVFIPVSKAIDDQLREFQSTGTHIAIVVDEYGGTSGLVTIEDILEEIVGEIHDEHDDDEPEIVQEESTRYWVAGRVTVDDLEELLETEFGVEDVATVAGVVYELFGRVPRSGESMKHRGFRIVVERVKRRRIERVYFERLDASDSAASGDTE